MNKIVFLSLFFISNLANAQNLNEIKVIAFDCFGTVFDLSVAPRQEVVDYITHIHQQNWSPLVLPRSWEHMPVHPDSIKGIEQLRRDYIVVTCSNAPLGFMSRLSKNAGIHWDAIIPLELNQVYKPNIKAYQTICDVFGVKPSEVLMVTANHKSGDLEAPLTIGMQTLGIRGDKPIKTIIELAEYMKTFEHSILER